jgi:hypothetical protein
MILAQLPIEPPQADSHDAGKHDHNARQNDKGEKAQHDSRTDGQRTHHQSQGIGQRIAGRESSEAEFTSQLAITSRDCLTTHQSSTRL